jgi:HPr kinase/phosphorylase
LSQSSQNLKKNNYCIIKSCLGRSLLNFEYTRELKSNQVCRFPLKLTESLEDRADSILIFESSRFSSMQSDDQDALFSNLEQLIHPQRPLILMSRSVVAIDALINLADKMGVPLLTSELDEACLQVKLSQALEDFFASTSEVHGTLVEVLGIGVLLQGASGCGKSETALKLIKQGHQLISDDLVFLKKKSELLIGYSSPVTMNYLELKGVGLVNIAQLFGPQAVLKSSKIQIIVELKRGVDRPLNSADISTSTNSKIEHESVTQSPLTKSLLDKSLVYYLIADASARDLSLIVETIVLDYKLKLNGCQPIQNLEEAFLKHIRKY